MGPIALAAVLVGSVGCTDSDAVVSSSPLVHGAPFWIEAITLDDGEPFSAEPPGVTVEGGTAGEGVGRPRSLACRNSPGCGNGPPDHHVGLAWSDANLERKDDESPALTARRVGGSEGSGRRTTHLWRSKMHRAG